jgi:hypothetical protein
MRSARIPAVLTAVVMACATSAAQAPPPAAATTIQQQNEDILRELRAIRVLLESVITPQRPA